MADQVDGVDGAAAAIAAAAAEPAAAPAAAEPPAISEPPEVEDASAEWRDGATQGDHLMAAKAKRQSPTKQLYGAYVEPSGAIEAADRILVRCFVRHWYKATLKLWEDARHAQSEAAHQARLRQAVADGEARVAEARKEAEIALWAAADAQRAAREAEERAEADAAGAAATAVQAHARGALMR